MSKKGKGKGGKYKKTYSFTTSKKPDDMLPYQKRWRLRDLYIPQDVIVEVALVLEALENADATDFPNYSEVGDVTIRAAKGQPISVAEVDLMLSLLVDLAHQGAKGLVQKAGPLVDKVRKNYVKFRGKPSGFYTVDHGLTDAEEEVQAQRTMKPMIKNPAWA
jgi:hypothetical protein